MASGVTGDASPIRAAVCELLIADNGKRHQGFTMQQSCTISVLVRHLCDSNGVSIGNLFE